MEQEKPKVGVICSFCKKEIKAAYHIVEKNIECSPCYYWLNSLLEKIQPKRKTV
jgi:hypothetical protein